MLIKVYGNLYENICTNTFVRGTFVRRTFDRETICTGGDLYERHFFDDKFLRVVIYTKSILYVVYLYEVRFVRRYINIILGWFYLYKKFMVVLVCWFYFKIVKLCVETSNLFTLSLRRIFIYINTFLLNANYVFT